MVQNILTYKAYVHRNNIGLLTEFRVLQPVTMDCQSTKYPNYSQQMTGPQIKLAEERLIMEADVDIVETSDINSENLKELQEKASSLKNVLKRDLKAADLKWSLFVTACNTYRYNSCLKPFPPMYIKNECKDIEGLRETIELVPPLEIISKILEEPTAFEHYRKAIELLYWVLVTMGDPFFKAVPKESYNAILGQVPSQMSVAAPDLIFQLVTTKQSTTERRWDSIAQNHPTFYAYHGSRLENFHSITHYGLQQSMCKKSLFGKGIYLSSELGVSLPYSPVGYGWGGCLFGNRMSCVALCELITHSDVKSGDSAGNSRGTFSDTMHDTVPKKYYLVTNSDLVRVRYLLVYCDEPQRVKYSDNRGLLAWFKQHKLLTFVLGYVVLLASVGLSHNKQVEKYYKLFVQKVGLE